MAAMPRRLDRKGCRHGDRVVHWEINKVERLGGKTIVPPTEIPGMVTYALFHDPDGNHVGLIKG